MNTLVDFHEQDKPVAAKLLFKGQEGVTTAIQIKENALLKEHTTKVEALLLCISGEVFFENEEGLCQRLTAGGFIHILPEVKHWVRGVSDSQLILIK